MSSSLRGLALYVGSDIDEMAVSLEFLVSGNEGVQIDVVIHHSDISRSLSQNRVDIVTSIYTLPT